MSFAADASSAYITRRRFSNGYELESYCEQAVRLCLRVMNWRATKSLILYDAKLVLFMDRTAILRPATGAARSGFMTPHIIASNADCYLYYGSYKFYCNSQDPT